MLTLLLWLAGSAGAAASIAQVEVLRCGATDLRMTSRTLKGPSAPLAPIDQHLVRRERAREVPVALERSDGVNIQGGRVLGRYVASWACIKGVGRARYVLLGYACAIEVGSPHDCGGEKEWFRLLNGRGGFVDTGVPHDGAPRDKLYARLGIAKVMAAGVTMTPVLK